MGRNGSPDLVQTGIDASRMRDTENVRGRYGCSAKKRLFVITTLVVEEYSGRRRLLDLQFLKEPLIADTTPPWFS